MASILFVCMGNICRSPTAEGVFRALVEAEGQGESSRIDSAGTIAYHAGQPPDRRMREAAARRGYQLVGQARQVSERDFFDFDWIVAMDRENLRDLRAMRPDDASARLGLFCERVPGGPTDVPDPYYGGPAGFERVLDLVEAGSRGWLDEIRA